MALSQVAIGAVCGATCNVHFLPAEATGTRRLSPHSSYFPFYATELAHGMERGLPVWDQLSRNASWRTSNAAGGRCLLAGNSWPAVKALPRQSRRAMIGRSRAAAGASTPEEALKSTVELDRFIDKLLRTESHELPMKVAENVLAFDRSFWLRLASRAESCQSEDDQKDFQDLASQIMTTVDAIVKKTQEKIDDSTGVLEDIVRKVANEDGEIWWPPASGRQMADLKQAVQQKQGEGQLDEGFLAAATAQLRQATEKGDRPGLVALLQKVLQLYAATWLAQRSYATRPDGGTDEGEKLLEDVIAAEEEEWEPLISRNLTYGGGPVAPEDLLALVEKRMERILMRTEGGSYQQRIVGEYLNEIDTRTRAIIDAFKTAPPQLS